MSVHHIALRTPDVARLVAFYRDAVGLVVAETPATSGDSAWLLAGDTRVMVERRRLDEPGVPAGSMEMVAFAIAATERAAALARCASLGVTVEHTTAFTLYVRDPDGRRVGMSHYPTPAP